MKTILTPKPANLNFSRFSIAILAHPSTALFSHEDFYQEK
ncbi:hypothetical protein N44_02893 [Microcystis aeruginosa NIES-44]|uniref:Uncharacterized protein n=1 Tax=Microcystis aeruginosa NIES-44 TaxID=449439 RepID=A0A0A1VXV6_MICAE|nr:hypothetical protein N44_02893 [Microcystis aeruginosa NIES-44]